MFKGFQNKKQFKGFPNLNFQMNNEAYGFSGLIHWFDAAYGLNTQTNGASISYWQSKTNLFAFTQNTAANQPLYISSDVSFNNLPVIDFSTGGKNMGTNPLIMVNKPTIVCVASINALSSAGNLLLYSNPNAQYSIMFGGNNANVTGIGVYNGASSPTAVLTTTIEDFLPHIVIFTSTDIIIDGVVQATGTLTYPNSYNQIGSVSTTILQGKIAEILIYNTSLTSDDAIMLSDNLNSKYAIY